MKRRGFTLIELLVTIAVMVILATVAVPSFQRQMASNRIVADYNELLGGLTLARSEAIKRRTEVTFSLTGTSLWGYNISVDGVDESIRIRSGRDKSISLTDTLSDDSITFGALGKPLSDDNCPEACRITLISTYDGIDDRALEVSAQGRVGKWEDDEDE